MSQPPSADLWAPESAVACDYVKPAPSDPQLPDHLHSASCAQTLGLGYWSCGQHEKGFGMGVVGRVWVRGGRAWPVAGGVSEHRRGWCWCCMHTLHPTQDSYFTTCDLSRSWSFFFHSSESLSRMAVAWSQKKIGLYRLYRPVKGPILVSLRIAPALRHCTVRGQ